METTYSDIYNAIQEAEVAARPGERYTQIVLWRPKQAYEWGSFRVVTTWDPTRTSRNMGGGAVIMTEYSGCAYKLIFRALAGLSPRKTA